MKIAVCVKAVPDAASGRRIDPATKRLDRSGELALSDFDTHAVEEALQLKEAAGDGEVVVVSMGPERALDALRKALAMGADRAVLVTDEALAGADLLGTAKALAGALERESADLVLFGQQSADGGGACLWAAVAERLRRPVDLAGQRADRRRRLGDRASGRPSTATTRFARRCRRSSRSPTAINKPRYPSLKGIMGAKKKPQETRRARPTSAALEPRARPCSRSTRRRRAARRAGSRTTAAAAEQIVEFLAERRLAVKTLVFLEHHDGAIQKGSLGVLAKAAALGGEVAGVRRRLGRARGRCRGRRVRRATVWVADDERLAAPLPQPRVDVLAKLVRDEGFDTVLFAQSVLAADVAAGLAARLDAGLNWDLVDLDGGRPSASGPRSPTPS